MQSTKSTTEKRSAFKALHAQGCFVLPNPWDVGSALLLQGMGFQALATTSSGFAWSRGQADGAVPGAIWRWIVNKNSRSLQAPAVVVRKGRF